MKFNKSLSLGRLAKAVALGVAISAVLGVNAQAGEFRKSKEQTRSVYLVKYQVGNAVRYGKNPAGKVMRVLASNYANSNPYVCTPSGFGQKARCRTAGISKQPDA